AAPGRGTPAPGLGADPPPAARRRSRARTDLAVAPARSPRESESSEHPERAPCPRPANDKKVTSRPSVVTDSIRRHTPLSGGSPMFRLRWALVVASCSVIAHCAAARAAGAPLVRAVGCIGLTVSDLDRSVAFYSGVLSFERALQVE